MSLLNNTKWVGIAQAIKVLCQLLSLIVLARLIPPEEYGLMAMAGVVVALGFLFRDMGTSAALIQKKEVTEDLKNAVFWLNVITGIVLAILIVIFAPLSAQYFGQDKLVYVLLLLALSFPITSLASSHLALLERQSQFKKIAFVESASSIMATALAIAAAYCGWGVYSLVLQALSNAIFSTIFIWRVSGWRPSFRGYRYLREIKQIFGFSGNLVAFNFINYFYRNVDRYVIGRAMTSSILGAYDLAYKIMLFPLQTLTFVIGRALFPILARLQEEQEEFHRLFIKVTVVIAFLSFPMMTGLMVLREGFVDIVFGKQWYMVALILFWLAPVGMLQALNSSIGGVLSAKGRTDVLFRLGVVGAVLIVSAFLLAAYNQVDIVGFCKYYLIANIINFFVATIVVCKTISLDVYRYLKPLFSISISCIFIYLLGNFVNHYLPNDLLSLMLKSMVILISYIVILFLIPNKVVHEIFVEIKFKLMKNRR